MLLHNIITRKFARATRELTYRVVSTTLTAFFFSFDRDVSRPTVFAKQISHSDIPFPSTERKLKRHRLIKIVFLKLRNYLNDDIRFNPHRMEEGMKNLQYARFIATFNMYNIHIQFPSRSALLNITLPCPVFLCPFNSHPRPIISAAVKLGSTPCIMHSQS